mmetsp:Transcript_21160/g.35656  ORF Transcript_21160/g.35656 Transcript_21160/m.35656 type:complete len:307 (-) Transcript_21160:2039-2959(-)
MIRRLLTHPIIFTKPCSRQCQSMAAQTVFVYNLSFDVKSEALTRFMSKAGKVINANINMNKRKKSKGTAVVTFESASDVATALANLHGLRLYGREVQLREDRMGTLNSHFNSSTDDVDKAAKAVYVGNLNTNVTRNILKAHMESAGPVRKATILRGKFGESHGCGVVEYEHSADAVKALSEMYNTVLNGRLLYVREDREARKQTDFSQRRSEVRGKGTGSSIPEKGTCVILGNIDKGSPQLEKHIRSIMEAAGDVKKVLLGEQLVGKGRGKIIVEYATRQSAVKAIAELHGKEVDDRKITVQHYGK